MDYDENNSPPPWKTRPKNWCMAFTINRTYEGSFKIDHEPSGGHYRVWYRDFKIEVFFPNNPNPVKTIRFETLRDMADSIELGPDLCREMRDMLKAYCLI